MVNAAFSIGHNCPNCSLSEVGGVGRVAPQRLAVIAAPVEPVLPYNGADGNGDRIAFYPVPVVGGEMARQKSSLSMV